MPSRGLGGGGGCDTGHAAAGGRGLKPCPAIGGQAICHFTIDHPATFCSDGGSVGDFKSFPHVSIGP